MSVPSFQQWFSPLLFRLADGETHNMTDLFQQLADDLGLSAEDRAEVLSSGKQTKYQNRIGWARTYLKKAGLVDDPSRGTVRITERGRQVLSDKPAIVNVAYLRRYPEFLKFHTATSSSDTPSPIAESETPEDTLERVSEELRQALALELLDRIKAAPPDLFERLVVDLLLKIGYGGSRKDAGEVLGKLVTAVSMVS